MEILYTNTRDASETVTASQAILNGLAGKGGLYVPTAIPHLDVSIEELAKMSYQETAYAVMRLFLSDFTEEELKTCIERAYDSKFDTPEIAPLTYADGAYFLELFHGKTIAFKDMALSILPHLDVSIEELAKMSYQETAYAVMCLFLSDFTEEELKTCIERAYDSKFDTPEIAPLTYADGAYFLELFHGKTIAFKDMALSILPHLLIASARKNHVKNDIVILTATSGDTGKAALAGFADVEGTKIIVFYPKNGVSPIQEKQMVTQKGANTFVVGIHGNFDEAQTGVKKMFSDPAMKAELDAAGYQFSSANSINIGRLVPQIVYYVYAYARLYANGKIAKDETINVVVPTGNFGNILAAYYAKQIGLPIDKLVCASNENKVLYDFFSTGAYDKNREFVLTSSPSMDILISSNLERLIYHIAGNDAEKNAALMRDLSETGKYEITPEMREKLATFYGNYTSEQETAQTIHNLYEQTGYVIDTHTAVAAGVYKKYVAETDDTKAAVIASTASPFKFSRSVMDAIDKEKYDSMGDFELVDELSRIANVKVPQAIEDIRSAEVLHKTVCDVDEMPKVVKDFLGIES